MKVSKIRLTLKDIRNNKIKISHKNLKTEKMVDNKKFLS